MSYRTKRPATRALLTFGVGATLAITQLGAGCVPPGSLGPSCETQEASVDDAGNCVVEPPVDAGDAGDADGNGGDAK